MIVCSDIVCVVGVGVGRVFGGGGDGECVGCCYLCVGVVSWCLRVNCLFC